jgi:hypothetical protein
MRLIFIPPCPDHFEKYRSVSNVGVSPDKHTRPDEGSEVLSASPKMVAVQRQLPPVTDFAIIPKPLLMPPY